LSFIAGWQFFLKKEGFMRVFRFLFVFLAIALSGQIAGAYSGIYFFGDSLMDVGNVWAATSHAKPLDPAYWNGRFCNGKNYADQLSEHFGLPAPTPSIFPGGNDYAWGGAGTAISDVSHGAGTPNLGTQVTTFLADLNGGTVDPNRLVVLWIGGNDPIFEGQMDYDQSVSNIVDAVNRLVNQAGAKNILVNDLPLLGNTPYAIYSGQAKRDELNGWTSNFNTQLEASLVNLQTTLSPSGVTILDSVPGLKKIDERFNEIIADPLANGITNVTDPAYPTPDSGIPTTQVPNSDHYLFWDFVHPTTVGVGALLVPEPSTIVLLIFSAVGFSLIALRRCRSFAV
jgi:phospholipase/lecithinase/hemolysin